MTSRSRSIWKSIKSIISPVPHRQFTINTIPFRRRRPACMARSTCLVWLKTGEGKTRASTSKISGDPSVHPRTRKTSGNVNPNGLRGSWIRLISRAPRESEREVARFAASFAPAGHQNAVYFIPPTVAPFCRQAASWLISYNGNPRD